MKVIHVCNHFYPCIGGIETSVQSICSELIKHGHKSDVVCLNKCSNSNSILKPYERYRNINIYRLPYINLKFYKVAPKVLKIIKRYDLIHVHGVGFFADFLASTKQIHKKPLILSTHGGIFHTKHIKNIKKIYFGILGKTVLKQFDRIIAVSEEDKKLFLRATVKDKIIVIPNGINYNKLSKIKRRQVKNTFIYIGRISKNKRADRLIETMSYLKGKVPEAKLYIIGKDWEGLKGKLENNVKKAGLNSHVFFTGELEERQLIKYLSKAQFFVSASEYEGFGISVIEAMACGIIPILNNIKQFKNLIRNNKEGFIVNFSDPSKCANLIRNITNMNLGGIRLNSKKKAKYFDWNNVTNKLLKLYSEITHNYPSTRKYLWKRF